MQSSSTQVLAMESRMERRLSKEVSEIQKDLMSLKDCKTVDDFQWDKLELIRGETPENIKERCLKLCQDYISGDWDQQTVDSFEFRRLSGGMTNQLYYCSVGKGDDSQAVAIRIYGPKHFNNLDNQGNERLTDVIIALMVSENQLGPKIYGVFEDGQIQHFYKHRQFRYDEQMNPVLAERLFQSLARVHSMDVPIKKNTNWVFNFFDDFYKKGLQNLELFKEHCPTMVAHPLKDELEWLKTTIKAINTPIVFTHIDFRGSNIMVTEPDDWIILVDFEYSSYGYRGFDFGTILTEWNRTPSELFVWGPELLKKYPDDSQLKTLLTYYINEMVKIHGKEYLDNPNNSIEQLVREAKLFSCVANMFIILFCIKNDDNDENDLPFDKNVTMGMAERNYQGYFYMKDLFNKDNNSN